MFVSIVAGRPRAREPRPAARPSSRARRWSSAIRSTIVSSATSPAAAAIPARARSRRRGGAASPRACSTTASLPASIAPNGAERPLLSEKATEFAGEASSASGTPSATDALMSRAPSMCTRQSCRFAAAARASVSSGESAVPPARVCVFSRISSAAWWRATSSSTSAGSSPSVSRPQGRRPRAARPPRFPSTPR